MALIDSGAGVNLVRNSRRPTTSCAIKHLGLAAGGQDVRVVGKITATLFIGGHSSSADFLVVPDLHEEVILGQPWLTQEEAVLNFQRQCIHFGRQSRSTAYWGMTAAAPTFLSRELPSVPEPFKQIVEDFAGIFQEYPVQTTTRSTRHTIRLKDTTPVRIPQYRFGPSKMNIFKEEAEKMLQAGVIEPSTADYHSPVIFVPKKSGGHRFCVDFRRLNDKTHDELAMLPPIDDAIKSLGGATVFTLLDLKAGYWQVPLSEASRPYTTFSGPDGATYQFRVMPFGLKNAPATFQKLMVQEVLTDLVNKCAKVYLDDILVYSASQDEHQVHLRKVFERLSQHHLFVAPEKCRIAVNELDYLGYRISGDGTFITKHHLEEIESLQDPSSRKELRSTIGLLNWIREFVPNFSEIVKPLTDLLPANKKFRYTVEAREALAKIKEIVATPLELKRPLPGHRLFLQTDASGVGMGAVLYQLTDNGNRRLISCASAKYNTTERKYHVNEQEMLAVIWAIRKYRHFLEDARFTLKTDSRALTWFQRFKDTNAKLTRWSLLLQELNFDIEHCPGRNNELPDFLSRHPATSYLNTQEATDLEPKLLPMVNAIRTLADEVIEAQRTDTTTRRLRIQWHEIAQGDVPGNAGLAHTEKYVVEDEILYYRLGGCHRLFVPECKTNQVLRFFHDHPTANHPGIQETYRACSQDYYWPNQSTDVKRHVNACLLCNSIRTRRQPAAPLRPHVPLRPWHTLSVDILGPYETTPEGFQYIITAMDIFSKWVEARPTATATTEDVKKFLDEELFARWGYPRQIISDSGGQFTGRRWEQYCQKNGIETFVISVQHQRANPVERRHQELKKAMRALNINKPPNHWNRTLHTALFNLRTRMNSASGCTPAHALLGQELTRPGEWHNGDRHPVPPPTAEERTRQRRLILDHQNIYRRRYVTEPPRAPDITFHVGNMVMVRENRPRTSFAPSWTGPHPVVIVHGTTSYTVERDGAHHKVHVDDLRPAPPED